MSIFLLSKYFSSRFSSRSESFASERLENLEEMFPWYYMHSDVLNENYTTTHMYVIHHKIII